MGFRFTNDEVNLGDLVDNILFKYEEENHDWLSITMKIDTEFWPDIYGNIQNQALIHSVKERVQKW